MRLAGHLFGIAGCDLCDVKQPGVRTSPRWPPGHCGGQEGPWVSKREIPHRKSCQVCRDFAKSGLLSGWITTDPAVRGMMPDPFLER